MDVNEIAEISRLMAKHGITEFNAESEGLKLCLKREIQVTQIAAPIAAPVATMPAVAPAPVAPTADAAPVEDNSKAITAPIVGTFYAASGPDQPNFVKVGDTVTEDTVVCIVEAMKVMNEIKAEITGTITEILVDNGTAVEFGQPLFKVK